MNLSWKGGLLQQEDFPVAKLTRVQADLSISAWWFITQHDIIPIDGNFTEDEAKAVALALWRMK
jgi:hypothetical protein